MAAKQRTPRGRGLFTVDRHRVGGAPRGGLIVFEGPDGVGKTTLSRCLWHELDSAGVPCELMSFPGREPGTLGRLIYELHHCPSRLEVAQLTPASMQVLHAASQIDAIESRIKPAIHAGRWVIVDRFWWSTWVYGLVSGVSTPVLRRIVNLI